MYDVENYLKINEEKTDPFFFFLQIMQFTAPGWGEGKWKIVAKFLRAHFQPGNQKQILLINYN